MLFARFCLWISALLASPIDVAAHIQPSIRTGDVPIRGVNLGGWLVAEHWMIWDSSIWTNVPQEIANQGEYVTMQYLGHEVGDARFEQHRATWITEDDIREIASFGLNTVRVPVGFWIVGFDHTDVSNKKQWQMYAPGALKYLDLLINEWANKYNLAVMLSLHAHKGSQNGYDHSAPLQVGERDWSAYNENLENSVQFAAFLAQRYRNSSSFLGLNLMNEPNYPTDPIKVNSYYQHTYQLIRDSGNDCVIGVSPMVSEQHFPVMQDFMNWPQYFHVWHEWHPYFIWGWEGASGSAILNAVDAYASELRS